MPLFTRLLGKASTDPELTELLRGLASLTLAVLPAPIDPAERELAILREPEPELASPEELETLVEHFANRPVSEPEAHIESRFELELAEVPARLRLKARACCWLAEHGYTNDPAALGERRTLIADARANACYLWMLDRTLVDPNASGAFTLLATNYEATAQVMQHWLAVQKGEGEGEVAELVAEAQAALRVAISAVRNEPEGSFPFLDEDQRAVFGELKRYSAEHGVFLYGLALRDTLDPAATDEGLGRLAALEQRLTHEEGRRKARQNALKRLSHHAQKLLDKSHNPAHNWERIAAAATELLETGVPESDARLRDALAPVAALLPVDTPYLQLGRIVGSLAETERAKVAL